MTPVVVDAPASLLGTGPVAEGGDGLPDGSAFYDATLAAKRQRDAAIAARERETQQITA
ncbi:MAG: hypothetical protein JWN27_2955 [Candidatus Eremiobacteraeota bacterium]|nr:hypothetical protein [Candidatus Eremiobacteraeota bacterium]